jgi:uracil-DNA glycosylase family 4
MNNIFDTKKLSDFDDLVKAASYCSLCTRLYSRVKVLSDLNGNVNSKVLFIAEAPGRLGADRTKIPLYGDRTGNNFDLLLGNIGWNRKDIFITNAILCNPRDESGNNSTPTLDEIKNCSTYLRMTINLIKPDVIATLGQKALESLNEINPHNITLKESVGKLINWSGFKIFPLYHPGPRAVLHRSFAQQKSDFMKLSNIVDPIKGLKKRKVRETQNNSIESLIGTPIYSCIISIIKKLRDISFFKLTKLLYLVDLHSIENLNESITKEIYLRQLEGPWIPKLKNYVKDLNDYEIFSYFKNNKPFIKLGSNFRSDVQLDEKQIEIIIDVIDKYGNMSDAKIKYFVYQTEPMKHVLEMERNGENAKNKPLIYQDRVVSKILCF